MPAATVGRCLGFLNFNNALKRYQTNETIRCDLELVHTDILKTFLRKLQHFGHLSQIHVSFNFTSHIYTLSVDINTHNILYMFILCNTSLRPMLVIMFPTKQHMRMSFHHTFPAPRGHLWFYHAPPEGHPRYQDLCIHQRGKGDLRGRSLGSGCLSSRHFGMYTAVPPEQSPPLLSHYSSW